jgi:hypothetical protein
VDAEKVFGGRDAFFDETFHDGAQFAFAADHADVGGGGVDDFAQHERVMPVAASDEGDVGIGVDR